MPNNHNTVSFLSDDKSSILTRVFNDDKPSWKKTRIINSNNRVFYSIKSDIELFTDGEITINLAEGIIDIISVYGNFNSGPNSIYTAILGIDYISGIDHWLAKGIIGPNINIRIFIDSNINEKDLKKHLKKYKWLFKNISIYKNAKFEDFGTKPDKIQAVEISV